MHPCLFQGVPIHDKETELCSKERDTSVQPFMQSTSDLDVSLHGEISQGRPPDEKKNKVFSQLCASMTKLAEKGALKGATTTLRSIDRFQGELNNFLKFILLFLTHIFALIKKKSNKYDDISMVSKGHSIYLGQQMISLHKNKEDEGMATSFHNSTTLSLLRSLDSYWESQLLVEYSKKLFTCKVLDGKRKYRRYKVVDGVIFLHDQIYLTKES